jgi:gamma-glutamyl:cysteine ligase YbdK (ATP-grasp superfamily)
MSTSSKDFTIGVEEEYQIVNPTTRELRSRAARILAEAEEAVGDQVTNELYLSEIEIGTPVCSTLAEVRSELVRLRRELIAAAIHNGSRIAAAGTHPFSRWEDQPLTPKPRYRALETDFKQLIRELVTFGCHVHIGIPDPEEAIRVMNRARSWMAPLIALCRGIARACADADQKGIPINHARSELLRAAKWQAARYGLEGDLVDVAAGRSRPAAEVIEALLAFGFLSFGA